MSLLYKTLIVIALAVLPATAHSEAVGAAVSNGVTVTLFDEPCALEQVTNLPYRATWTQDGKVFEGCFGGFMGGAVVGAWFDDGTMAVIPVVDFKPVTSM